MDEIGRLVREHFEAEVRSVPVPAPALPLRAAGRGNRHARRVPHSLADRLARTAAVIVALGALVLLGRSPHRPAALQPSLAAAVEQRAFQRILPGTGALMDMIDASFGRRISE
jgi:hypothetical protein